jgi:glycosyltransferase involved in cell wall biosynthesis
LVSVVLPTYNRAELLRHAVESVVAQSFQSWELIILDDGSTDDTRQYLRSLADSRIHVVEADHCASPAKLRNVGVRAAKGRYIAFLDSDDVWAKEKLDVQLADLKNKPAARWSYTCYQTIDQSGRQKPWHKRFKWRPIEGWIFEELLTLDAKVTMPTVIVERTLLEEAGGFDETLEFSEDYELWLRLARRSPAAAVGRVLAGVRDHTGNTWRAFGPKSAKYWLLVYQRLLGDPALRPFRRTCKRMRARAAAVVADIHRSERHYGDGIRVLIGAPPVGLLPTSWWVSLAKTCLRPFTPERALGLYRKLAASRHHA